MRVNTYYINKLCFKSFALIVEKSLFSRNLPIDFGFA
jgi:hypothetical protein